MLLRFITSVFDAAHREARPFQHNQVIHVDFAMRGSSG
jgi:hypothetical protein